MLLMEDGQARATIVTGGSPSAAEVAAARELKTYLWKLATAAGHAAEKLPIETEAAGAAWHGDLRRPQRGRDAVRRIP